MGRRGGELRPTRSPLHRLLRPPGRQVNQALLVVLLLTFGTGVAAVAVALALVPLVAWHVWARGIRPRRTDLSRRTLLRASGLATGALALYVASETAFRGLGLPGARRRFTGSYETASFRPEAMPSTSWLLDAVPSVDPDRWRLAVKDARGRRELTLAQLARFATQVRATLDCTSGWYSQQDWTGVPLATLIHREPGAQSVYVHSVTGYWIRLPVHDLDSLLLATGAGGAPLSADHGFPVRLVAPGRRGYWWVKWVDRIELQASPSWWQPPFPVG